MSDEVLVLAGDGIGPEIVAEAVKVLDILDSDFGLDIELDHGLIGGSAIDATGSPLPDETLVKAKNADALLVRCRRRSQMGTTGYCYSSRKRFVENPIGTGTICKSSSGIDFSTIG